MSPPYIGPAITGVVDGLKSQPMTLALVVINLALLGVVWYETNQIFAMQSEINALLSKCVDADILRSLGLLPKAP